MIVLMTTNIHDNTEATIKNGENEESMWNHEVNSESQSQLKSQHTLLEDQDQEDQDSREEFLSKASTSYIFEDLGIQCKSSYYLA